MKMLANANAINRQGSSMNLISKENLESLKKALSTAEGPGIKEALALCEGILAQEPQKPAAWILTNNHGGGRHSKTLHFDRPAEPRFPALAWIEELYLPSGPLPSPKVAADKVQSAASVVDKAALERGVAEHNNINLAKRYGARITTRNLMSNPVQVVHEVDFASFEKFKNFCDDLAGMKGKQVDADIRDQLCKTHGGHVYEGSDERRGSIKHGVYFMQNSFHRFCAELLQSAAPAVAKSPQVTWPKL